MADPALIAASLQSASSMMIRVTRRPMRPNPLTPIPVAMDMEAPLEVAAFNEVPEKEYAEAEPTAARERAAENFMFGLLGFVFESERL